MTHVTMERESFFACKNTEIEWMNINAGTVVAVHTSTNVCFLLSTFTTAFATSLSVWVKCNLTCTGVSKSFTHLCKDKEKSSAYYM